MSEKVWYKRDPKVKPLERFKEKGEDYPSGQVWYKRPRPRPKPGDEYVPSSDPKPESAEE